MTEPVNDSWWRIAEAIDEEHVDRFNYRSYPYYPEAVANALREAYGAGIRKGIVMAAWEATFTGLLPKGGKEQLYSRFFNGRRKKGATS